KCYDKDGEKSLDQVNRNEQGIITDNLIIKGNNLLALHSLKQEFAGKVKLIYIDPPYNREAESFYNDNFKNSTWLTFMKNRLEVVSSLLTEDGLIFIQIDDFQFGYLLPLCDEIFDRENRVNIITVKMSETSGVKMSHVEKRLPKIKEFILVYRKSVNAKFNPIKITKTEQQNKLKEYLKYYSKVIVNPNDEPEEWQIISIKDYLKNIGKSYDEETIRKFQIENADRVVYRTNNKSFETLSIQKEMTKITSARVLEYIWWEGNQMLFLSDYIEEYVCDLWTDISTINLNKEVGVDFDNGNKAELVLQRIIQRCTKENDIVLDYQLGSGTTASTAHKMNRQYIGIEQMDYIETVAVERLKKVIDGEQGGISKSVNWQGGGSFVYLEL